MAIKSLDKLIGSSVQISEPSSNITIALWRSLRHRQLKRFPSCSGFSLKRYVAIRRRCRRRRRCCRCCCRRRRCCFRRRCCRRRRRCGSPAPWRPKNVKAQTPLAAAAAETDSTNFKPTQNEVETSFRKSSSSSSTKYQSTKRIDSFCSYTFFLHQKFWELELALLRIM